MKTIIHFLGNLIITLFFLFQFGAKAQTLLVDELKDGATTTYFQICHDGTITLCDLENHKKEIVGKIDLSIVPIPLPVHGWKPKNSSKLAIFFLSSFHRTENWEAQLFTYDFVTNQFCEHDFYARFTGDFGIFYLDKAIWNHYYDIESLNTYDIIYDIDEKKTRKLQNCKLPNGILTRPHWVYDVCDPELMTVLFGSTKVIKMNLAEDMIIASMTVSEISSTPPNCSFIVGLSGDQLLMASRSGNASAGLSKFDIIDIRTQKVVSSTSNLTPSIILGGEVLVPSGGVSYFEIISETGSQSMQEKKTIMRFVNGENGIELKNSEEVSPDDSIVLVGGKEDEPHFIAFPKDSLKVEGIESFSKEFWQLIEKYYSVSELGKALHLAFADIGRNYDCISGRNNVENLNLQQYVRTDP